MKAGFYPRLALDGIRKNKRLYLPYLLTCIGMVAMYYIVLFLKDSRAITGMPGGGTIQPMLDLGSWVIAVFSVIFLFYTHSFLIRRRKKEFGLYNVLGMSKRNIGRILFWEALIVAVVSLALGLAAGLALSKLAELGLVNVMHADVTFTLEVSPAGIGKTAAVFGGIFLLLFFNSLLQVRGSDTVALMRSESTGDRPPRGNWFFGFCGVLILGGAYYIALKIEDPITALVMFFVAVIMVIVGTYLLMISGSVLFCRILQKNKKFYYKPNHFVSVSSMVYRMKRNGAGLASICILATMVLVMVSTTTSLYVGSEDVLASRYPREIMLKLYLDDPDGMSDGNIGAMRDAVSEVYSRHGVTPQNLRDYREASVAGHLENGAVETDPDKINDFSLDTYANVHQFQLIPLSDYNRMTGETETLEEDEVLLYAYRTAYAGDRIAFNGGGSFRIKRQLESFVVNGDAAMDAVSTIVLIVPDIETGVAGLWEMTDGSGNRIVNLNWKYEFDTGLEEDAQIALSDELYSLARGFSLTEDRDVLAASCESRAAEHSGFYTLFGGLFYLGIALSVVFVFAAVLIIYYKQISEGYEDQARFEIMQKVGMTKKEIRRSINSQLLTVFFLPLIGAGCHLIFAFPIIRKMLLLFSLTNVTLYAVTTLISFLIFALFYTVVYRLTSNAYFHIVSGAREAK